MSLRAFPNDTPQVSKVSTYNWVVCELTCYYRLKIRVTAMTHSQAHFTVEDKWTEIIEDLWKHLPHFQDEKMLYNDECLKFNCVTLQFGDREESDSDSETWPHQSTSDMEDSFLKADETKEDCELTMCHSVTHY